MVAGMMINRFKSTFEEADLDKNGAVSYQGQSLLISVLCTVTIPASGFV